MKTGMTLTEMAVKLEADKARMKDLAVDTRQLNVLASAEGGSSVHLPGMDLEPTDLFHRQLGTDLSIRADFYDRLLEHHPDLYNNLVNGLLGRWTVDHGGKEGRRMIRTYTDGGGEDGSLPIARAVLSDRYRRIDNYELLMAALPMIEGIPGARVESCDVTEKKMYVKVVAPLTEVDLRDYMTGEHVMLPNEPDFCQAGFIIRNSEVGQGQIAIDNMLYRLVCKNGLIVGKALRRTHIGSQVTAGDDLSIFRDETLEADDKALMMKVQDAIAAAVDTTRFEQFAAQFAGAKDTPQMEAPIKAMEVLGNTVGLSEGEGQKALENLLRDGDTTKFGAVNAITRMAQDVDSYDRSTELEELAASQVLAMPATDWGRIAATV